MLLPSYNLVSEKHEWQPIGDGFPGNCSWVEALALDSQDHLYAGGYFHKSKDETQLNNIATYNLKNPSKGWQPIGNGLGQNNGSCNHSDDVTALALDAKGNIYAAGKFESSGANSVLNYMNNISKYSAIEHMWIPLGHGLPLSDSSSWIDTLKVHGTATNTSLIAGGSKFQKDNGNRIANFSRYIKGSWVMSYIGSNDSKYESVWSTMIVPIINIKVG